MILVDDIISIEQQENIKNLLLGNNFPWYFIKDITKQNYESIETLKPALFHNFIKDSYITSDFYNDLIETLFLSACDRVKLTPTNLLNCRSFLQFPLPEQTIENQHIDDFHVDLTCNHKVILYYVKNSDGNTIITDDKITDSNNVKKIELENINYQTVVPKQGRLLYFDGKYFHSAEQPRVDTRCVINFNFI